MTARRGDSKWYSTPASMMTNTVKIWLRAILEVEPTEKSRLFSETVVIHQANEYLCRPTEMS